MTVKWFYIILIERGKISYVYMEVNKVFVGRCQNIKIPLCQIAALELQRAAGLLQLLLDEPGDDIGDTHACLPPFRKAIFDFAFL